MTEGFLVILALVMMAVAWTLDRSSFKAYLKRKAEPHYRTPVNIDGEFFYIVPEREFVAIKLRAMRTGGFPADEEDYKPMPTYGAGREKAPRD